MIDEVTFLPGINKTVIGTSVIDEGTYQDDFDNILAYCDTYYGYYEGWNGNSCIISNEGRDKCNQILPTNDGGFIAVGFNSNTGDNITTSNGGSNIYLAKIFPGVIYPDPFSAITGVVNFGQLVITQENELSNEMIYPNPFVDKIQIQVLSAEESKVALLNQFGQVVFSSTFVNETTLNTENLPSGLYFIQLNSNIYRLVK